MGGVSYLETGSPYAAAGRLSRGSPQMIPLSSKSVVGFGFNFLRPGGPLDFSDDYRLDAIRCAFGATGGGLGYSIRPVSVSSTFAAG